MSNDRSRRRVFPASSIMLEKRWELQRYEQHQNKVVFLSNNIKQLTIYKLLLLAML